MSNQLQAHYARACGTQWRHLPMHATDCAEWSSYQSHHTHGRVVRPTVHATDYNNGMLYACFPGKGKQPVPARLRASANRANDPLQLTGSNKFNPRASIKLVCI